MENQQFDIQGLLERSDPTISRKIALHLEAIENAIAKGVSHEMIVMQLRDQKICDISLNTFRVTIYRLRKRKDGVKNLRAHTSAVSTASTNPEIRSMELRPALETKNKTQLTLEELARLHPLKSERELRRMRVMKRVKTHDDDLPPLLQRLLNQEKP